MTDREVLFLALGALKGYDHHNLKLVTTLIEEYLFPKSKDADEMNPPESPEVPND